MTREEEIKNYACNNCINDDVDDTSYSLIVETAKWADKTMIVKACEWLKDQLVDNRDNCGYSVVSTFDTITVEEFICDFKKAMEL